MMCVIVGCVFTDVIVGCVHMSRYEWRYVLDNENGAQLEEVLNFQYMADILSNKSSY